MIPWITTKQFHIDLFPSWNKTEGDKDWSLGAVTVDVGDAAGRFERLIAELNEDQWEVKMVVPLDKSLTYHEHQKVVRQGTRKEPEAVLGAFGLGWAAPTTAALIVVCQRTEWLTEEEYRGRITARRDRLAAEARNKERASVIAHNAAVNAKITAAQKMLDDIRAVGVEARKSGFLRGEKFVFNGTEFTTRAEAEAAMKAKVTDLETDLVALPRQLKDVPAED